MIQRRTWLLVAGILLSAGLLAASLRGTSREGIVAAVGSLRWTYAVPFLAFLAAFYLLKAVRWRGLLAPLARARVSELVPVVMIGYAANAILPAQIGEVVRGWLGARRLGVPVSATLASILLERLFDFAIVLLALALALATGRALPPDVATAGYWTAAFLLAAMAAVLALAWFPALFARTAQRALAFLPQTLAERISHQVVHAAEGLQAVRRPALLAVALLLSLVKWGCMLACVALSLMAAGIDVGVATWLLLLALTVLGVSLPTAPGYVGTIQFAYALALVPAGVDPSASLAASLFYHALAYAFVVIGGLVFVRREGLQMRRLGEMST